MYGFIVLCFAVFLSWDIGKFLCCDAYIRIFVLVVARCDQEPDLITGLILGLHPTNGRRDYKITPSLIGLAQT